MPGFESLVGRFFFSIKEFVRMIKRTIELPAFKNRRIAMQNIRENTRAHWSDYPIRMFTFKSQ